MILYQNLNLNLNPLIKGKTFDSLPNYPWILFDVKNLSDEIKDLFNDLNLKLLSAGLFTTIGSVNTQIHLDGHSFGNVAKINWVISTHDHLMNWYTIKDNTSLIPSVRNSENNLPNRSYVNFEKNQVEFLDSAIIGYPSLVNVGLPHNISNLGGIRRCLTVMLFDRDEQTVTMENAIDIFNKFKIR